MHADLKLCQACFIFVYGTNKTMTTDTLTNCSADKKMYIQPNLKDKSVTRMFKSTLFAWTVAH